MFIHGRISALAMFLALLLVFLDSRWEKTSNKLPTEISEPYPKPHGAIDLRDLSLNIQELQALNGDDLR
jgi:hypothetical protein